MDIFGIMDTKGAMDFLIQIEIYLDIRKNALWVFLDSWDRTTQRYEFSSHYNELIDTRNGMNYGFCDWNTRQNEPWIFPDSRNRWIFLVTWGDTELCSQLRIYIVRNYVISTDETCMRYTTEILQREIWNTIMYI